MDREALGRVAYEGWFREALVEDREPSNRWWNNDPYYRERFAQTAEAVRAAVIAAEFGPHASVVTTAYLTALQQLARWVGDWEPYAEHAHDCPISLHIEHPCNCLIEQVHECMAALRAYPDWQRKGAQP